MPPDLLVRVKAVPNASRDAIAGVLPMPDGDRLKIQVAAPPENGRANLAIARLLAGACGVRPAEVELVSGTTNPLKVFRLKGVALGSVPAAWTT